MSEKHQNPKYYTCTLSDDELVRRCEVWVDKLCKSGGDAWVLRVPPDFNNDPDLLIDELIKRFKDEKKNTQ